MGRVLFTTAKCRPAGPLRGSRRMQTPPPSPEAGPCTPQPPQKGPRMDPSTPGFTDVARIIDFSVASPRAVRVPSAHRVHRVASFQYPGLCAMLNTIAPALSEGVTCSAHAHQRSWMRPNARVFSATKLCSGSLHFGVYQLWCQHVESTIGVNIWNICLTRFLTVGRTHAVLIIPSHGPRSLGLLALEVSALT